MRAIITLSILIVSLKGVFIYLQAGEKDEDLFNLGNFWVLGPLALFLVNAKSTIHSLSSRNGVQLGVLLWFGVLLFHSLYNLFLYGFALSVLSFLAWGVWLPLGIWGAVERKRDLDGFIAFLVVIVALAFAASVFYEFFTGEILLRVSNRVTGQDFFRYSGLSGSPVSTGLVLTCGIFASSWLLAENKSRLVQGIVLSIAGMCVFASLLCLGRLALALGVIGVMIQGRMLFKQSFGLIVFGVVTAAIAALMVGEFFMNNNSFAYFLQAFSLQAGGNVERLRVYEEQLNFLFTSPVGALVGTGAGSTGAIALRLMGDEETTESSIIRLIREFGVLGSAAFLAMCGVTIRSFWRSLRLPSQRTSGVVFGIIFCIVIIQSTFAETLDGWVNSFLFFSMICVAAQLEKRRNDLRGELALLNSEDETQTGLDPAYPAM